MLDCGRADPWSYPPPVRGYAEAAAHLLDHGLLPAPNLAAMRDMWKADDGSRRVARTIAECWEMAA